MLTREQDWEIESQQTKADTTSALQKFFSNKVLFPSAVETIVGGGFAAATTPFLAKDIAWWQHPITIASGVLCLNFFSRIFSNNEKNQNSITSIVLRNSRSITFSFLDHCTRAAITHESGHVLASLGLYQNPKTRMTIKAFGDGLTEAHGDVLTHLGEIFGKNGSQLFFSAAGTSASMLWNAIILIIAQAIPEDYPEIKSYLRFSVFASVLTEAIYALTAYWDCKPAHDFCNIKDNGFSPIGAVSLIVGTVLFLQFILSSVTYCKNKNNPGPQVKETDEIDLQEVHHHSTDADDGPPDEARLLSSPSI
jgi:hypothetical protein